MDKYYNDNQPKNGRIILMVNLNASKQTRYPRRGKRIYKYLPTRRAMRQNANIIGLYAHIIELYVIFIDLNNNREIYEKV